jgi:hypothetical protein
MKELKTSVNLPELLVATMNGTDIAAKIKPININLLFSNPPSRSPQFRQNFSALVCTVLHFSQWTFMGMPLH